MKKEKKMHVLKKKNDSEILFQSQRPKLATSSLWTDKAKTAMGKRNRPGLVRLVYFLIPHS